MRLRGRVTGWLLIAAALIAGGWTSYQAFHNEHDSYDRQTLSNDRQKHNTRNINDIQSNEAIQTNQQKDV